MEPDTLANRYQFNINRPQAAPAGAPRNVDASLDPAIEQVRKQRASGKDSSMEFPADNLASRIIAMGGINPESVGAGDLRKVGRVGLLNNSGMTVEAAAEALANDGLGDLFTTRDEFGRPDYRELLEMLSDEAQGLRTFTDPSRSVSAAAAVENQSRVDTVAGIISKLEGQGVAVDDLSVPELRALIEPMLNEDDVSGETGPSGMFYQDALPDTPTYEQLVAELARVNNLLRTDQLTGMRNRFAFEEDANLGWTTVSMLDLDGLKNLNDAIGQHAGDSLLKAAGSVMLAAETDGVRFYRYGGDEYTARIRDPEVAAALMQEVVDRLDSADVTIMSGGVEYLYQGIGAGYGIGQTFNEANENEKADKQRRLDAGVRERRGTDGTPGRLRQLPEGERRGDGEGAQPEGVTPEGMLFQSDSGLVATHNISGHKLLHALRMGGIAVPSLAVTKADQAITGFGEITLVGSKSLVDPKRGAKTFGADIYSPRYPSIEYKLDKQALQALNEALAPYRAEGDREIYGSEIRRYEDLTQIKSFKEYAKAQNQGNSYAEYKLLAEKLLTRVGATEVLFNGYTNNGNRKYKPHTLDNVIKELKKNLRGGENFNYGTGSLRAKFTPQFSSIAGIQKAQDRLVSAEDFEAVKAEVEAELFAIVADLAPYSSRGGSFAFTDTVIGVLEDSARIGMSRALADYDMDGVPEETKARMGQYLTRLRNMPTEYFEAKLLRAVDPGEFSVAVVPSDVSPEVLYALQSIGLPIVSYTAGDDTARRQAVQSAAANAEVLFQSDAPLVSALAQSVDAAKGAPKKGDATAWKGWLDGAQRRGEFKQAERDWMGVDAWLDSAGEVTREQLQEYVRANQLQIQEVSLGVPPAINDVGTAIDYIAERVDSTAEGVRESYGYSDDADYISLANDMAARATGLSDATKFSQYQLPGGENYRELLLTLPAQSATDGGYGDWQQHAASMGFMQEAIDEVWNDPDRESDLEFEAWRQGQTDGPAAAQYRSSHFDQPNILAHVRFNERTDADGKRVLFLEEVQSDWHQAGRKSGYKGAGRAITDAEFAEFQQLGRLTETTPAQDARYAELLALNENGPSNAVPDAPFKTTWPMLVMKRMLRYAAENGFDRIAWTTGEQQAARYDLSKQVNEVTVGFRGDERMVMIEAGGNTMERAVVNVDGVITESKRGYEGKGLDEVIGKEMADKIMGLSAPANLKGDDLKIGGEGMRAFYDKMLPAEVNKLGKKFGAKVGRDWIRTNKAAEADADLDLLAQLGQDVPGATRGKDVGMEVHSLDITPALREAALEGLPLFQGGAAPRGGITGGDGRSIIGDQPGADGRRVFNISLFAGMNYSTFLHENAHAFLEIFGDLAEAEGAPQQVKDDWSKALKFMGVENRGQIGRDQHELWARAGEAYLREGRAPSPSLRRSFANFKVWLTGIYRTATSLRVELTDEVRGVFDRMYATDAEIAEAKQQQGLGAMFRHGETIGMTPEEEVAYWNAVDAAQADAESALVAEVLTAQQRAAKAFLSAERRKVQAEVEATTRALRPYKSIRWLRQGLLPDGSPVPTPIKLSRQALIDAGYLPAFIQRHLSGMYSKNGGMSLETAAELLGYGGGAEMVQEIVDAPALQEVIKADTARIMAERYPDPLVDGTLVDRAMEAVHREKQGEAMLLGVQALERHVDGRVRSQAHVLMEVAKRLIATKRARDLQPNTYRLAEAKNGRLALAAAARQDWPAAASAARQQLLAHHLYNEARRARAEVDAAQKFLRKQGETNARQKLGKAGNYLTRDGSYLEQVDGILERYDLKPMSGAAADRRASLASWIQSQEEAGYDVAIPDSVRNEAQRTPFRELTVEQVREVRDAVKHIVAMARLRNKLLLAQDGRTLDDNVADLVATAEANHTVLPEAMDLSPSFSRKFGDWLSKIDATLLKPEFLFTWLDGEKANGQFWRKLFQPFVDAEADEVKRMAVVSTALRELFKDYKRGKLSVERIHVPAAKTRKFAGNFTRESLLVVGLNMGNDYNRQAMMDGFGWTDAQLQAVAAHLTEADWDTVAGVWKLYESVRPDAFALEKAMTGLEPEQVEAAPFMTPNGRMLAGGYHPIKFDSAFSFRAFQRDAKQAVQDAYGGNFAKAATKKGHLKARTGTGGQPIKLSLSVVSEHLTNVIHDVTHRRALFDVQRLLDHPDVRGVIEATAGRNAYRVLNPWLQRIGADPAMDVNPLEAMFRRARVGATVVNMGFKVTTALTQLTGYTQSIEVMGAGAMAVGFREFGRNPRQALRFAMERSQVLPHRMQSYDRDVRDSLSRITSGGLRDDVQRSFFFLTGMVDMGVVVPTWLGAYHKAIGGDQAGVDAGNETDAIAYADGVVRQSQSSGSTKDLAMVQRGNEAFRMFTMFYSYFSVLYNLGRRGIRRTKSTKDLPRLAASTFYLWFVPYVLAELLAGRGPEDDEEWGDWWVSHVLPGLATYPIQTIPVVRDIVNGAVGDFGYSPSPAFDAFESAVGSVKTVVVKGGKIAISKLTGNETDEEIKRRDIKQLVMTAGYWGKLPSRQAWITGSYLYDLAVGNEQPENIGDVFNGLAFSRPEPKE
jgi:diguanylate cyclase (GGDEF)-like protein